MPGRSPNQGGPRGMAGYGEWNDPGILRGNLNRGPRVDYNPGGMFTPREFGPSVEINPGQMGPQQNLTPDPTGAGLAPAHLQTGRTPISQHFNPLGGYNTDSWTRRGGGVRHDAMDFPGFSRNGTDWTSSVTGTPWAGFGLPGGPIGGFGTQNQLGGNMTSQPTFFDEQGIPYAIPTGSSGRAGGLAGFAGGGGTGGGGGGFGGGGLISGSNTNNGVGGNHAAAAAFYGTGGAYSPGYGPLIVEVR